MSYNNFTHIVVNALGFQSRLPVDGLSPRFVLGVKVWVEPIGPSGNARHQHRLRCACPDCGKHVSLGRLPQHQKVHGAK